MPGKRAISILAVACVTTAGCTSTQRQYTTPSDFCGQQIESSLYEPLLPPGKEIETPLAFTGSSHATMMRCFIKVDNQVVVHALTRNASSIGDFAHSAGMRVELQEGHPVPGPYKAMTWPGNAIVVTECTVNGQAKGFGVGIEAKHPGDPEESQRVLAELIHPFMESTLTQYTPCDE